METIIIVFICVCIFLLLLIGVIVYHCLYVKKKPIQNAHPQVNSFNSRTVSLENHPSQVSQTFSVVRNTPSVVSPSTQPLYPPGPPQQGTDYYPNPLIGNGYNPSVGTLVNASYDYRRKKYPTHHRHSYTSPPYPTSPSHPLPQSPTTIAPYPTFPLHPLPHTSMYSQNLYNPTFSLISSNQSSPPYPTAPSVHYEFNLINSEGSSNNVPTSGSRQAFYRHSFASVKPPSYDEAMAGNISIENKRKRLQKNNSLYDNNN